ncbi:MAG: hypothetical protein U5R30_16260 [Deltaproteobacteria bacterium]|nr:hypothetical protein [Deltaproteobacteria bacterium]
MTKRIIITIVGLIAVIGVLGGIKGLQIERMIAQGKQFSPPPEPVNTAVVRKETLGIPYQRRGICWKRFQVLSSTPELPGKVERIEFEAGTKVKAGDLPPPQDISTETA